MSLELVAGVAIFQTTRRTWKRVQEARRERASLLAAENYYAKLWREGHIQRLAENNAIRGIADIKDDIGEKMDFSIYKGKVFNPFPDLLEAYLKRHPEERQRLADEVSRRSQEYLLQQAA